MALGIEPPWVVTKSDFDATAKRLDIHLDFARGNRFACPQCGIAGCPTYDSEEKTWRHLNFFQHEAYLHARVPRVTCKGCGIKQVSVPWVRSDSGFTLLFDALVMAMVQAMPVAVVARMFDEWDTRLWRVIHHYVEAARDRADHSEVTSGPWRQSRGRRRGVHRHEPGLHPHGSSPWAVSPRRRGKPAQRPDHVRQIPRRQAHQRGRRH